MNENDEVVRDVSEGIEYIRAHKELNNVLLTGGDPLLLATGRLEKIISQLREIKHVKIIRIGSKMMAFNPFRISEDPELLAMLARYSTPKKKIYLMCHFNHPRELTPEAIEACRLLQQAGVITVNQTPLLRGINDDPEVLGELFNKLSFIGVPPYYVFQGRPILGNHMFAIPIEEGYAIFERARMLCSGLAKRARFVMSHATGKIEVVGITEQVIMMRYHRSAHWGQKARMLIFKRNPAAYWLEDYTEPIDEYHLLQDSFAEGF
jgi:KamA family protein